MSTKINIKWGKELFKDVEVNVNGTAEDFRAQLFSLSNVPAENQKVMGKGKTLKDNEWEAFKKILVPGTTLLMVGTPAEVVNAVSSTTTTTFVEDLPEEEQHVVAENLAPGLSNLGNTCYMNSTLQMMNAIPELGTALDVFKPNQANDAEGKVTLAMKDVLRQLRTQKSTISPLMFLAMLRISFPRFAEQQGGKYMQQCADECWTQLILCLKRLPKLSIENAPPGNNAIEQLIQGEMVSEMKCIELPDEPAKVEKESFDSLHCHIDQKVDFLSDGIVKGLETSLEKHNPTLNKDAVYKTISRVNRLPYYLVVNFLRFEWKGYVKTGTRAKICRPVEFPFELDAFEYCSDELKASLKPKREEVRQWNDKPSTEDKPEIVQAKLANQTGYYELAAVLTHRGRDADGGHYICWVRQDGDNWLKFDDDDVSRATPEDIKKLSGKGGSDWHMAFMCLYRTKLWPATPAASSSSSSTATASK